MLARLRAAGLLPKKRFGQHFLLDPRILAGLVSEARLGPGDRAFEVGTGPGVLTRFLAERASEVFTVEVDARMLEFARAELADLPNVRFLRADALARGGRWNPEVEAVLAAWGPFAWVSNLPYGIASTAIVALLESGLDWTRAVLTVQSEVADRLLARPGETSYGPLTLLVAFWASVRGGRRIRAGAFWPPPKVESRVVVLEPRPPPGTREEYARYREWVRKLFTRRRKQLAKLLRDALGETAAREIIARSGWRRDARPESLDVGDFLALARAAKAQGPRPSGDGG
ncbi:MAG: 16S rRNA (adenine(1518)-N(6)/adenine(1519)-N(6))-dimethyltransferase RsmA [Planctomycetota bacterium]